jgi:holin-like protein
MIHAIALLLSCQLAGEVASRSLGLPVPGPVLGLVLLFLGLQVTAQHRGISAETIDTTEIGRTANGLLQVLALLFVPAGAGVVQHLGLLGEHGVALFLALVGSTVITLLVTVFVFQIVGRWLTKGEAR